MNNNTDLLVKALSDDGYISVTAVSTRALTERAREIHRASRTAAAALGRTMAGALLLASTLKNDDANLTVRISGGGPIGTITAVAEAGGSTRCCAANPEADVPRYENGKLNVGALVGKRGMLTVIRDEGAGDPYSGGCELVSGEIAEDFAQFLTVSEQQPSAVALGVLIDSVSGTDAMPGTDAVTAAGGYMVSLLPGLSAEAANEAITKLEQNIKATGNVTQHLVVNPDPFVLAQKILEGFGARQAESRELCYRCTCSRERVRDAISGIGEAEIRDIKQKGDPIEVTCKFCDNVYIFQPEEL